MIVDNSSGRRLSPMKTGALLLFFGLSFAAGVEAQAHSGHSIPAMWQVCEDATIGDDCRFVGPHGRVHIGTCRGIGGDKACVRNRPLQTTAAPTSNRWNRNFAIVVALMGMAVVVAARIRKGNLQS